MQKSNISYYDNIKEELIRKYKKLVNQCMNIIDKPIDDDLTDDKLHTILKAKRMASEDIKHYAREIDVLENDKNGIVVEETTTKTAIKKFTKK